MALKKENGAKFALSFSGSGTVTFFADGVGPVQSFGTPTPRIDVTADERSLQLNGVISVTAAGTLRLQFSRFASVDGNGTTLRAGSFMVLTRLN